MNWKQGLKDRNYNNRMYSRLKFFKNLSAAVYALFCLTTSFTVLAQSLDESEKNTNLILLLRPDDRRTTGYEEIHEALEAHLESNSIKVETHKTERFSRIPSEQMSDARTRAKEQNASAVIWIYIPSQTLYLIFEDKDGNEQTLSRYFSCIGRSLGQCGDAIASAVSSALSVWIGHEPDQTSPTSPAHDNELSPVTLEGADWKTPALIACFLGDAGYVFNFGKSDSSTHGLHLGVGATWKRHLGFELSGEFLATIEGEKSDDGSQVELLRRPVRLMLAQVLPIKRASIGISGGLLVSVDLHRQHHIDERVTTDVEFIPGFTSNLTFRFRLLDHLGLFASTGMDIYSRTEPYQSSASAPGVKISTFQWRLALGLSWSIEIRNTN